jgi:hypothetical protein
MAGSTASCNGLPADTYEFYRRALSALLEANVPFLVGGAYAYERYTGIARHTKDFDIFVHPRDFDRTLAVFQARGYQTEMTFPHWIGKAFCGDDFIDIIFSSGNGIAAVDQGWFDHAVEEEVLGLPLRLIPAEEMIWSKAFIMERERYDGGDVAHVIRACGEQLDWVRLVHRFGPHWRVLLSHVVLFGFIYPCERSRVPRWVLAELSSRLLTEADSAPPQGRLCQGTFLSRSQYLVDVDRWGYEDPRVAPLGNMTSDETARWTAAALEEQERKAVIKPAA